LAIAISLAGAVLTLVEFHASEALNVTEVVGVATAYVAVTSSDNPATVGVAVTYTATVTGPANGATPTGSVTFYDGGTAITNCNGAALDASGDATCTVTYSNTTGSPHTITAGYTGDSNYSSVDQTSDTPSVSESVNAGGSAGGGGGGASAPPPPPPAPPTGSTSSASTAAPLKTTPPTKLLSPKVAITLAQAIVQGPDVAVRLVCVHAVCSGRAKLSGSVVVKTKRGAKTVSQRETVVLATGTYDLAAGSTATVRLLLTPAGEDAIASMAPRLLQAIVKVTVQGARTASKIVLVVPTRNSARTLAAATPFFVPAPAGGAAQQEALLKSQGDLKDASLVRQMLATPQAVWFDGVTLQGRIQTPLQVESRIRQTLREAALERSVPVLVASNIPGRDCSSGGAIDESAYDNWISAFARGIGNSKAVVILEPESLVNLPSDCAKNNPSLTLQTYPFTDSQRLAEIKFAVNVLETDPRVSVYLDAGNSSWQPVGTIAQRLVQAGVQNAQGFVLNVFSDQYTANSTAYGTWVSDCIAYTTFVKPGDFSNCPNQYWNGGPPGTEIAKLLGAWKGVALNSYGVWNGSTTTADLNISGIDADYANLLGATLPITHFVIDTSENGRGMNDMEGYAAAPYHQPASVISTLVNNNMCNPPGAGLGLAPTSITGDPLVDAYLWLKTPGESTGQCDSAGGQRTWDYKAYTRPGWPTSATAQSLFDPLWGTVDPASGSWFGEVALQLVQNAEQTPKVPQNK
jgi:endoglucanase